MTKGNYKLRYATQEDADLFYSERKDSFRAWILEYKGEIVGIGGYVMHPEGNIMFAKGKEGYPKKSFWRATKEIMKEVTKIKAPLWAFRDHELDTSKDYLKRLGFRFSHIHNKEEVYLWHKS